MNYEEDVKEDSEIILKIHIFSILQLLFLTFVFLIFFKIIQVLESPKLLVKNILEFKYSYMKTDCKYSVKSATLKTKSL